MSKFVSSLETVEIKSKRIPKSMFSQWSIKWVIIENNVEVIEKRAFEDWHDSMLVIFDNQ